MPKYFIHPHEISDNHIHVSGETAHHLLNVIRIKPDDSVIFGCNGQCINYHATLLHTSKNSKELTATFIVDTTTPCYTEPNVHISLFQALPKGDKMDLIVQKCVELGVGDIIPIHTERTIPRIKDNDKKIARYQKIAESAAGQSMRGIIPDILPPCTLELATKINSEAFAMLAHEQEQNVSLKSAIEKNASNIGNFTEPCVKDPKKRNRINIWIGPEGGFTDKEVAILRSIGAIPVSLGKRILRTETAAIAAIAQIICLYDS